MNISNKVFWNTITSVLFIVPYVLFFDFNLSWLCLSSLLFTFCASYHHLYPTQTYGLTFLTKSLYTQFLFSVLDNKLNDQNVHNYLFITSLIISLFDLLPLIDYNKFELFLGMIRHFICFYLWYLSPNQGITGAIYIIGQILYIIDRNIRIKKNPNLTIEEKRLARSNYTYYHCILHVADMICFCYWI